MSLAESLVELSLLEDGAFYVVTYPRKRQGERVRVEVYVPPVVAARIASNAARGLGYLGSLHSHVARVLAQRNEIEAADLVHLFFSTLCPATPK